MTLEELFYRLGEILHDDPDSATNEVLLEVGSFSEIAITGLVHVRYEDGQHVVLSGEPL